MIYQRHIPREELFSAQLEMLMQNGQLGTLIANTVGMVASMAMFWPFVNVTSIMLWGAAFLILLLLHSLQMSNGLVWPSAFLIGALWPIGRCAAPADRPCQYRRTHRAG